MKTAYELAMERLNQSSPPVKLTAQQKKDLAELESKYKAKIAERELFVGSEREKAIDKAISRRWNSGKQLVATGSHCKRNWGKEGSSSASKVRSFGLTSLPGSFTHYPRLAPPVPVGQYKWP